MRDPSPTGTGRAGDLPPISTQPGEDVELARWWSNDLVRCRIPALSRTARGTLIAAFDARPSMNDLPEHIRIVHRRSSDNGRTWGATQTLLHDAVWSHSDPSLITDHEHDRVICFATAAVHTGFATSRKGNDPCDRHITQLVIAVSDDDGVTWERRVITPQAKSSDWHGMFATSGEGAQLRGPEWTGRLIQPCVVRVDGENFAVSVISDDHGETWRHGDPIGPDADENAVVELHDGRVLLNVRTSSGRRSQAVSSDGGVTFSALNPVEDQLDPGNNASIQRAFRGPDPTRGRERVLLLTSTPDPDIRQNLSLTCSFDGGQTWTAQQLLVPGSAGYSTLTPLDDETFGLLYEHNGYSSISFRRFRLVDVAAGPLHLDAMLTGCLTAGSLSTITVRVRNTSAVPVNPHRLAITGPDGIGGPDADFPSLDAGQEVEIPCTVDVPATVAGPRELTLTARGTMDKHPFGSDADGQQLISRRTAVVTIHGSPEAPRHAELSVEPVLDAIYPDPHRPGPAGDLAVPWVRVRNCGNTVVDGVVVCDTTDQTLIDVGPLSPGSTSMVREVTALGHVIDHEDIARGYWAPEFCARGTAHGVPVLAQGTMRPLSLS